MLEEPIINEGLSSDLEETIDSEEQGRAAFTIVVQSWATPIISIIMLAFGFLGGFYGRPLIETETTPTATQEEPTTEVATIPTPDADLAAQQQALMEMVVGETRHFRGDPDAPVTIIEFSDYQ